MKILKLSCTKGLISAIKFLDPFGWDHWVVFKSLDQLNGEENG